jgi:hypothetical protein
VSIRYKSERSQRSDLWSFVRGCIFMVLIPAQNASDNRRGGMWGQVFHKTNTCVVIG